MSVYETLENQRKEIVKKRRIYRLFFVLLLILAVLMFFILPFISVILGIVAFVLIFISENKVNEFQKTFKETIVKKLLDEELENYQYDQIGGIDLSEIINVGIYERPDRHHLEDYISSSYNNVKYEMCDAKFEERYIVEVNGRREVRYKTYFQGRIIKIDYNKDLNTLIKIIEGNPQGLNVRGLTKISTESIEFNKKYKTYVSNQESAFYYLTPLMIQKLLELEKLFSGTIQYSITSDAMYIFINNSGDSLEVNIKKPIDENQLEIIKSQILLANSIINEFNLDKNKFNKEITI